MWQSCGEAASSPVLSAESWILSSSWRPCGCTVNTSWTDEDWTISGRHMKTAFLFPGQGAQAAGMGKDVAEAFPEAKAIYARASQVLGFDLAELCFNGPAEKLNTTAMSQPAIFVTSAALLAAMKALPAGAPIAPDICAGLSLGEYTALYAAGMIGFEDAVRLVEIRGRTMQAAADASPGGMVSLIGLAEDKVQALCQEAGQG
jgi:[acyl-carrier-protein] S-malonyltransferase